MNELLIVFVLIFVAALMLIEPTKVKLQLSFVPGFEATELEVDGD